jgi:cell division protein FtsZ
MAIHSPLLEIAINGAQGVLFNISGGTDLGMLEVSEAANIITESVGGDAKIIFGAIHDDRLRKGEIKVTVIATGFGREGAKKEPNLFTRTVPQPQMQTPAPSSSAHRVVVEDKNAKKHDTKQIEETDEWEIPAFIRKKK